MRSSSEVARLPNEPAERILSSSLTTMKTLRASWSSFVSAAVKEVGYTKLGVYTELSN